MKFWKFFWLLALAGIACLVFGMGLSREWFLADAGEIPFSAGDVGMSEFPSADGEEKESGEEQIADVIYSIFELFGMILGSFAIIVMVWSGLLLVANGGNEEKVEEGKRGFTWALVGLVLLLMTEPVLRDIIYRDGDALKDADALRQTASAADQFVVNMLSWLEGFLIIAAVGYLLVSGFSLISALGDSDQISKQKSVFLWIAVGVVVMLLNRVVVQEVIYPYVLGDDFFVKYAPDPTTGISEIVAFIKYILQFLALLAFLAFLYGGALMILSFGNDERVETGKKSLMGGILGILVVLIAYALVSTFITLEV